MPKRASAPDPAAHVPRKFRQLKLRKRRARSPDTQYTGLFVLLVIFALLALFVFTVDLGF